MDKSQKELIKTYYRKRGIAAGENNSYFLQEYEITDFAYENKLIDKFAPLGRYISDSDARSIRGLNRLKDIFKKELWDSRSNRDYDHYTNLIKLLDEYMIEKGGNYEDG
jgi:hypothetical protein